MICTKCTTPFCWLCNKALKKDDPYSHFRGEDVSSDFTLLNANSRTTNA